MSKVNDACWAIARQMTKRERSEYENLKVSCPICNLDYCLSYGGQDAYCHECRYHKSSSCLKELTNQRICQYCERRNYAKL